MGNHSTMEKSFRARSVTLVPGRNGSWRCLGCIKYGSDPGRIDSRSQSRANRTWPKRGECSSGCAQANQVATRWRKIWKLACPPKIKHFLWRLARNSLPLKMNIKRKGMKFDTRCPACQRLDEDGGHCFLKCKLVKRCWLTLDLEPVRQRLLLQDSACNVVKDILSLKEDVQLKTIIFLWKWWSSVRNKLNQVEKGHVTVELDTATMNLFRTG